MKLLGKKFSVSQKSLFMISYFSDRFHIVTSLFLDQIMPGLYQGMVVYRGVHQIPSVSFKGAPYSLCFSKVKLQHILSSVITSVYRVYSVFLFYIYSTGFCLFYLKVKLNYTISFYINRKYLPQNFTYLDKLIQIELKKLHAKYYVCMVIYAYL